MESVLQLIEAKKRYYIELDNISQLTQEETENRDIALGLSVELEKWISAPKHTLIEVQCLGSLICRFSRKHSASNNDDIDEGLTLDEDDIDDFIRYLVNNLDINLYNIPQYFLYLAISFGCYIPYERLLRFVASKKQEIQFELSKNNLPSNFFEELNALITSNEETYIIKDCLSDLLVLLGGERGEFDRIIDGVTKAKEVNAIIQNIVHTENTIQSEEITGKLKDFYQLLYDQMEYALMDMTRFKMGENSLFHILSDKELQAFNRILNQPFMEDVLFEKMQQIKSSQTNEANEPFTLPDNFFTEQTISKNTEEYLCPTQFDHWADVSKFIELITYLVDNGYIDDDALIKRTLTFRLTGRMRPKGELPRIQWRGGSSQAADCLFLMKCSNAKNKYDKMRRFFDADFPSKESTSSLVHSAGTRFMRKLNVLFPDIYKLPARLT